MRKHILLIPTALLLISVGAISVYAFHHADSLRSYLAPASAILGAAAHAVFRAYRQANPPIHLKEWRNSMTDTVNEALASAGAALTRANNTIAVNTGHLQTIATATQAVESMAQTALATTGQPPTAAQKVAAAVQIASALDPQVVQVTTPLEVLIGSVVGIFNLFGIFKHSAPVAPVAPPVVAVPSAPQPAVPAQ